MRDVDIVILNCPRSNVKMSIERINGVCPVCYCLSDIHKRVKCKKFYTGNKGQAEGEEI